MRTTVVIAVLALQAILTADLSAQFAGTPAVDREFYNAGHTGPSGCADPGCTDPGCTAKGGGCACAACGRSNLFATAEYLLWWGKGRTVPPLITDGVLGPGTLNYFGGDKVGQQLQNGGRITLGSWLDQRSDTSLNFTISALSANPQRFSGNTASFPVLAHPYFNAISNLEDAVLISSPGVTAGQVDAVSELDYIAAEGFVKFRLDEGRGYAIDFLTGYNFNRIDDALRLGSSSRIINRPPATPNTVIDTVDVFDTQNQFHGGMLGLMATARRGRLTLRSAMKFSIGNMHQRLFVSGTTTVTPPVGAPATDFGGLYALPTNMGTFSNDRIAYVPEMQVSLAYALTRNIEVGVGYNMIWWSDVVLAGDQIDRTLNLSQAGGNPLIGAARPAHLMRETEYWLQGATVNFLWNF